MKACDETKRCDKLYVDDKALLVNVLIGVRSRITIFHGFALTICALPHAQDDQCEALEVPYTTMCKIEVVPKQAGGSIVTIRVTTPPVARKVPVKSSSNGPLRVEFTLAGADAERFRAAVQSRKIVSSSICCVRSFLKPCKGEATQRYSSQAIIGKVASPP